MQQYHAAAATNPCLLAVRSGCSIEVVRRLWRCCTIDVRSAALISFVSQPHFALTSKVHTPAPSLEVGIREK